MSGRGVAGLDCQALLKQLSIPLVILRPDSAFTVVAASDGFLETFALVREQIVGQGFFDGVVRNASSRACLGKGTREALDRVVREGVSQSMPVCQCESHASPKEGEWGANRLWRQVYSPVMVKGELRYILCRIEDVTELARGCRAAERPGAAPAGDAKIQEARDRLRETEERFRLLVESAEEYAIFMLDPRGNIATWNPGAQRIKGYAADEAIGRHFSMFYPPEDVLDGKPDRELQIAQSAGHYQEEGWRLRKDGTRFWANVVIGCLHDSTGALVGYSKITRDLTDRKQAEDAINEMNEKLRLQNEQLEMSNQELEAFSYSVSHDLRAPLRSIDGFSQALLEDCGNRLGPEGEGYLQRVRAASQRMGQLIDALLGLARLTRMDILRMPVDLSRIAEEVAEDLRKSEPTRSVEFTIVPGLVADCEPRLFRAVMTNLLSNAFKFTVDRCPGRIEFGTLSEQGSREYFVRDNGVGFDMAHAGKLFGAFQRLHSAAEFPGTGVGLATVARIIRRHGGHVWAEGSVGQGATFFFTV